MTATELLKLAAKAAGYKVSNRLVGGGLMVMSKERPSPHKWNPWDDDGDALRLAVKLDMQVTIDLLHQETWIDHRKIDGSVSEKHDSDPCAATRHAIVRVAGLLENQ